MALNFGSGNGFQSANVFKSEKGMRLTRVRETRVVVNVIQDVSTHRKHMLNMKNNQSRVYYKTGKENVPIQPTGIQSAELGKMYDNEILYINRDALQRKSAQDIMGASIGQSMQATLVPCGSVLNGAVANSRSEIQRKYRPFAVAELTGRDTNTPGATGIVGGVVPFHNSLPVPMVVGDLMQAWPLLPEELREIRHQDGNLANAQGRVTYVYKKFDVQTLYSHEDVRKVILEDWVLKKVEGAPVEFVGAPGGPAPPPERPQSDYLLVFADDTTKGLPADHALRKKARSCAEANFARAVRMQIKAIADIIGVANIFEFAFGEGHTIGAKKIMYPDLYQGYATIIVLAAGFYRKGAQPDMDAINAFCKELLIKDSGDAAVAQLVRFKGLLVDLITCANSEEMFGANCLQAFVAAMAEHKVAAEESIMGICIQGAASGCNGEMHLRAYQH